MGFFSRSSSVSTSQQRISSFQVNQSSYGVPIKLIFGTAMVNGVLADYQDFTAHATTITTTSGGKGGGGVTQTDTTYTYSVAGVMVLGEGACTGVGKIWSGSKTTDMYALGMTFFYGTKAQALWGYMLSKHPDHALTYSGTSYVASNFDLGDSASLPNLNFEVYGLCQSAAPTQYSDTSLSKTISVNGEISYDSDRGLFYCHFTYNTTMTLDGFIELKTVTITLPDRVWGKEDTHSMSGNVLTATGQFTIVSDSPVETASVTITANYKKGVTPSVTPPTNQKMQQFSYTKEIEISNFQANRYVQEYVFNSLTGTGTWVTLNSRYYTIEQSKDPQGNPKAGVYTYTFNFDDRDDGYDRVDPTYVRIYYTAIQATVDYTPTDANPRDIIYTLLTSTVYGENFPDVLIDEESLAVYSKYCKSNQLLLSPVYGDQTSCSDIINGLMECTNSEYVFSQGKVKIIPYWDGLTPNYAISDGNIINQDEDTLTIERTSQADTYNIVPLEHTSRADQYNSNVVYATDEGDIELHGVRQAGTFSHPEIMNQNLAQAVAQLILQKQLYNRNRYKLKVGQEFILLEPMDACTLESDLAKLGITNVRVVEITESADDYSLEIVFEDNLSGVTTAPTYDTQDSSRAVSNTNAQPENANAPIVFEAPAPLVTSATGYEIWIYASGGEWWGGANVWVSQDGLSYRRVGTVKQPARQGVITTSLPVSATPDTTNTLGVNLSMSRSNLVSVTQQEANDAVSLCWIEGANNGEFISYRDATLTGQYRYNLSYLRRGVYGSNIMSHTANAKFVRCDSGNVLKIPFNSTEIGNTYYIKLTSFNVFGTVEQELSEVSPYTFKVHGYNKRTLMESGTATITKGTVSTITYQNKYDSPPYPQVTITNAETGDHLDISNMTTTSFGVTFSNNNAPTTPPETRQINYLIYGS